ncbi:MAG TPA: VanZ family protein, partial [Burkholderiales bacterium]|nr:VanZ family protein [Burkholderiales bacterium]
MLRAALIYAVFVVYGSLVPLAWHYRPLGDAWNAFLRTPYLHLDMGSRADWIANILLYIPLAFFATGALARRTRAASASIAVFVLCALAAILVEFTQLFFPPRTVSLNDIIAELIGSAIGIALWHTAGKRLRAYLDTVLHGGREAVGAFIALYTAAYLLFAVFPYDFVLSATELAQKLANPNGTALWVTRSCGSAFACSVKLASEAVVAAPLGVFLGMVGMRVGVPRAFAWGLVLGLVIEGLQIFLASGVSQGASVVTRGVGLALGLAAYRTFDREWLLRHAAGLRFAVLGSLPIYTALLLALIGFYGTPFEPVWKAVVKLEEVRFLPFYYHYFTSETQAMYSLLIYAGAYAPIGLMVWLFAGGRGATRASLWTAGLAAFFTAAAMETLKLFLQGKRPDPTDALIAAAAAALVCFVAGRLSSLPAQAEPDESRNVAPSWSRRRLRAVAVLVGLSASGAALAGFLIGMQPREHYIDESKLPKLPAPAELPPARFAAFRLEHPRLPNPTPLELDLLRRYSHTFVHDLQARARGGWGELEATALQQLIEPGSVDLALLHGRLLELRFSWRGHEQVKPLAVAYDWLYTSWTDSQREALRRKLADGCEYLVNYIRSERLSPYNVILYNSPLQALMACSIALYQDDPRGASFMAFTSDLWKNRVLPVWRQVMGKHGGWHEGGEYVGIGIGQA